MKNRRASSDFHHDSWRALVVGACVRFPVVPGVVVVGFGGVRRWRVRRGAGRAWSPRTGSIVRERCSWAGMPCGVGRRCSISSCADASGGGGPSAYPRSRTARRCSWPLAAAASLPGARRRPRDRPARRRARPAAAWALRPIARRPCSAWAAAVVAFNARHVAPSPEASSELDTARRGAGEGAGGLAA